MLPENSVFLTRMMEYSMEIIGILLSVIAIVLLVMVLLLLKRQKDFDGKDEKITALRQRLAGMEQHLTSLKEQLSEESRANREEITKHIQGFGQAVHSQISEQGLNQQKQIGELTHSNEEGMERLRTTMDQKMEIIRSGNEVKLEQMRKTVEDKLAESVNRLNEQGVSQNKQLAELSRGNEESLERLRITMDSKLNLMRENNEAKLEQMRKTVDEKLETTLNQRINESFNLVNERLEQVHKGLGEMQSLSTNLTDIKKIFSNVKSRGVWGEVQLAHILEEILTPEQYEANVATKKRSLERVEFAVRLPGRDGDSGVIYLPIDSKFPVEDYQRLLDAEEIGDPVAVDTCRKALERALKNAAKTIHDKYINPPVTLEYAVMFLPTEGLYAEALRLPSFMDEAQEKYQIMVAGPTSLAALLNSIKLGFRTLAIQAKSGEIRKLLGTIKTEMGRFEDALETAQKKISEADNALGKASDRGRILNNKLKKVELPQGQEKESLSNEA